MALLLRELDTLLSAPVELRCLGGFVYESQTGVPDARLPDLRRITKSSAIRVIDRLGVRSDTYSLTFDAFDQAVCRGGGLKDHSQENANDEVRLRPSLLKVSQTSNSNAKARRELRLAEASLFANQSDFARQRHALQLLPADGGIVGIRQRPRLSVDSGHILESLAFRIRELKRRAALTTE